MITATITTTEQTGMDDWTDFRYSKDFKKTATIQEIEDWALTRNKTCTFFHVQFSQKEQEL